MNNRDKSAMPLCPVRDINDHGLTKLEYAAIHILAGIRHGAHRNNYVWSNEQRAKWAIQNAKALFDELEKHEAQIS